MTHYDIFNGDADGLCALQQLRLAEPCETQLVTGVKRDIALLQQVSVETGDFLTVMDISFDKNRQAVEAALAVGASIRYFDHHFAGELPSHPALELHIDTAPTTCTSLLMDDYLAGRFRAWAVTGAFGDNMEQSAQQRAVGMGYTEAELDRLRELGTYLNYNGYGAELADLYFHPAELYAHLHPYAQPLDFIADSAAFTVLQEGYHADMARAEQLRPLRADDAAAAFILPEEKWARRVAGVYGNQLATDFPRRAHAVLTEQEQGAAYTVSVRAPLADLRDADTLCRQFATGGGRKGAAGINRLPAQALDNFIDAFWALYAK
ncbi:MAG: hypothetical protein R6X06_07090 [Gammaproteobacteria bacterium]